MVSVLTFAGVSAAHVDAERMALERRYTRAHSLGDNYVFDPRDGWETVNTTNLAYKYNHARSDALSGSDAHNDYLDNTADSDYGNSTLVARAKKTSKAKSKSKSKSKSKAPKSSGASTASDLLKGGLKKVMDSFRGFGKKEPVIITWFETPHATVPTVVEHSFRLGTPATTS